MSRRLPDALLSRYAVSLRSPEQPWQQVLRLNQSLWRQEQGYPSGTTENGRPMGSMLESAWAERTSLNLMSDAARAVAHREARAGDDGEKVVDRTRLFTNLLSSQPLCFSLFADLAQDPGLASKVISSLLGKEVRVTRVEFEYSPRRGSPEYTADGTAADVYVEYEQGIRRGFLCVEVKYHEDLAPKDWRPTYRPRYAEVAQVMGCFRPSSEAVLQVRPLEQLWRDHLLAGAILHHPGAHFDEGAFVLLHPEINEACRDAVQPYRDQLTADDTFQVWSLEAFVEALEAACLEPWGGALKVRYLTFGRVDRAYQDYYLRETTRWAARVREALGGLQEEHGDIVYFRPTTGGFTMVGLLPDKPQLGKSFSSPAALARVRENFGDEFKKWCDADVPARSTPEKRLQSFLIADALIHGRRMVALSEAMREAGHEVDLTFLTDELVIPSIGRDQRVDLLCLESGDDGDRLAIIELKSERAMTELLGQTALYAELLTPHLERLAELASAILGRTLVLSGPIKKWAIWPGLPGRDEPREREFAEAGVRLVGYEEGEGGFRFRSEPLAVLHPVVAPRPSAPSPTSGSGT